MFLFGMITIELMNRLLGVNTCFLEIGMLCTDEGTLRGSWWKGSQGSVKVII